MDLAFGTEGFHHVLAQVSKWVSSVCSVIVVCIPTYTLSVDGVCTVYIVYILNLT